jgi:hypothetical protein
MRVLFNVFLFLFSPLITSEMGLFLTALANTAVTNDRQFKIQVGLWGHQEWQKEV